MEQAYHYNDDVWGENYEEYESEGPWDLEGCEEEAYPAEAEDHDPEWDPESDGEQHDQNHALEEDDQDIMSDIRSSCHSWTYTCRNYE
jgi:hypothetical protein